MAQGEASDPNEQMELLKIKSTNVKLETARAEGSDAQAELNWHIWQTSTLRGSASSQPSSGPGPTLDWGWLSQRMSSHCSHYFAGTRGPRAHSLPGPRLTASRKTQSWLQGKIRPRGRMPPGRTHSSFCCFEIEIKFGGLFKKEEKSSSRLQITEAQSFLARSSNRPGSCWR